MSSASRFAPVSDADLARARKDPAFRQQLLTDNLNLLLATMQKLRGKRSPAGARAKEMREGAELAVRLAELIHTAAESPRSDE